MDKNDNIFLAMSGIILNNDNAKWRYDTIKKDIQFVEQSEFEIMEIALKDSCENKEQMNRANNLLDAIEYYRLTQNPEKLNILEVQLGGKQQSQQQNSWQRKIHEENLSKMSGSSSRLHGDDNIVSLQDKNEAVLSPTTSSQSPNLYTDDVQPVQKKRCGLFSRCMN